MTFTLNWPGYSFRPESITFKCREINKKQKQKNTCLKESVDKADPLYTKAVLTTVLDTEPDFMCD